MLSDSIVTRPNEQVTPSVTLFPTVSAPAFRVPAQRPARACGSPGERAGHRYFCNRPDGHTGKHARVRYWAGGAVRAVWGDA